jgi:histidinol-phosphate phosphatase family protein
MMGLFDADKTWSLFLDRDGVINERKMNGYILTVDEFQFLPQASESIAYFSTVFHHIFVVTNQQGISKGLMTERNLLEIHDYMCVQIEEKGGKISSCYFAPELKTELNSLRKPNPGMAMLAKSDFPEVDFEKSIMVGDTDSDIKFGKNLGMKTVRIKTVEPIGINADLTVESLKELMDLWEREI